MIVVWGLSRDTVLAAVLGALERRRAPVAFIDQERILTTTAKLRIDDGVECEIRTGDDVAQLDSCRSVYLRPGDWTRLAHLQAAGSGSREWAYAAEVHATLLTWAELTPALVVNRPQAGGSNASKPYQLGLIKSFGFRVPNTLLTTDPARAREFHERHREVVYKSISGVRSIVSRLDPHDLGRLDGVRSCPTQFQEYVPGVDHRVHVVGDMVFCARIVSDADDYRYARRFGARIEVRAATLPEECADRCRRLAKSMDLALAGIDLRLTPRGEWYCFEVNPSPGFTFYDRFPNQRIANQVARLLDVR